MPTTINEIVNNFNLKISGQVKWNEQIPSNKCGIYIVSISNEPEKLICIENPEFDEIKIEKWLELIKENNKNLYIDNKKATKIDVINRLNRLWLPDETILYIGKAGGANNPKRTIKKRIDEYYKTRIGCNKKHAGGNWINTLSILDKLSVFYIEFEEYKYYQIDEIETQLIEYFNNNVSTTTRNKLIDKINCFPFANKEIHYKSKKTKIRKKHGLKNQTIDCKNKWKIT